MRKSFQTITRSFGLLNKTCCSVDGIDVSAVQSHILYEIDVNANPTMQQVADLLGIEIATFSRQIQTLIKMELVVKLPSTKDKRVSVLSLTKRGKMVAAGIDKQVNEFLDDIFNEMTDFERETTQKAVHFLAEVMTKSPLCCGIKADKSSC